MGSLIERGVQPPPKDMITSKERMTHSWYTWFDRLTGKIPKVQQFSEALTPSAVGANSVSEQTFTVTGLTTSDVVIVNHPPLVYGLSVVSCRVSAANTLAITYQNITGGSLTPASDTYTIIAIRR